jgi:hypothetical protein
MHRRQLGKTDGRSTINYHVLTTSQGLRAPPRRRPRQVRQPRHPRPRLRRWPHLPGLRHPPGHRQVPHRLLPEVRRRALQEPAQAGPRPVRSHPPRRRQPSQRAQEVRRSGRPRALPEVLPINGFCARAGREREREESVVTFWSQWENWVDVRSRLGGGRFLRLFLFLCKTHGAWSRDGLSRPPSHGEKADRDGHVRFDARNMIGHMIHETCAPRLW